MEKFLAVEKGAGTLYRHKKALGTLFSLKQCTL